MEQRPEASIAIQCLPLTTDEKETVRIVDEVIAYIKSTGLPTYVGPFETTVEGDYETLMKIVKECQLICIREGAPQISSYVKIWYNPAAGVLSIDEKVTKHHE